MKNRSMIFMAILPVLACFAFLPGAQAVCNEGCGSNFNTFEGENALISDTTGAGNTAFGWGALLSNTDGSFNTATGAGALLFNTGYQNTAFGAAALLFNSTGPYNTAIGNSALFSNTSGDNNTAVGWSALFNNTTGVVNTAIGESALYNNMTGSNNTAIGDFAGFELTTGDGNVCIGASVLGVAGESNTTRIRNIYSSVASERAVYVNGDYKLGTLASSRRFKEEIKPMDKASEVLFALKPVSFRYKKEFDAGRAPMFGLIAEDVEQVEPALVSRNERGEVDTVRYEQINAMLLNEFLKEHKKVKQQQVRINELNCKMAKQDVIITQQQKGMELLASQLKEQAAQIQKVSAEVEMSKPAAKVVVNKP